MSLLIRNLTRTKIKLNLLGDVEKVVMKEEKIKQNTEVSLVFVGEDRIRKFNKIYRGIDRITDVLSFEGKNEDNFVDPSNDVAYLGEIFICVPRAKKQAREKGHSIEKEVDILLVHGLFHLLGYDHIKDADYEIMKKKEEKILKNLYR
ncbi:MAG: rRNA maturation RNase YbeY [Candidatus Paceibacterota bacterium]